VPNSARNGRSAMLDSRPPTHSELPHDPLPSLPLPISLFHHPQSRDWRDLDDKTIAAMVTFPHSRDCPTLSLSIKSRGPAHLCRKPSLAPRPCSRALVANSLCHCPKLRPLVAPPLLTVDITTDPDRSSLSAQGRLLNPFPSFPIAPVMPTMTPLP
jgi:hypothetical protein